MRLAQDAFASERADHPNRLPGLQAEKLVVEERLQGWLMSLGDRDLLPAVRSMLAKKSNEAQTELGRLAAEIDALAASERIEAEVLNPEIIMAKLQRLAEMMLGANPSATSLLLAQHIEGIHCFRDGRCELKVCKLGALAGDLEFIPGVEGAAKTQQVALGSGAEFIPRRRTRRDARVAIHDDELLDATNDFAVDPHRFAGMPKEWFVSHILQIPAPTSWARRNAAAVAAYRQEHHASMAELASQFNVSIPTVRKALREAEKSEATKLTGKLKTRPNMRNWARLNATKVAEFMGRDGATIQAAVMHFKKSQPTIKRALQFAAD